MPSLLHDAVVAGAFATRRKAHYASPAAAASHAARSQRRGPADPPASLRRSYELRCAEQAELTVWTLSPRGRADPSVPRIVYLHGSGYINPISRFHWALLAELERRTGAEITIPLYRMAPVYTWRHAFRALTAVYVGLLERGDPIVLMGDSAGGAIALGLAMSWRDMRLPQPLRVITISPGLDATLSNPAIPAIAPHDPILDLPGCKATSRWWSGGDDISRYEVSPINGDWSRLAPIDVLIGTRDILFPDCRRLAGIARFEDVAVHQFDGAFHVWPAVPILPESRQALGLIADLIGSSDGGTV
jgi:monoterpene epsilon-lactone hydrolase